MKSQQRHLNRLPCGHFCCLCGVCFYPAFNSIYMSVEIIIHSYLEDCFFMSWLEIYEIMRKLEARKKGIKFCKDL